MDTHFIKKNKGQFKAIRSNKITSEVYCQNLGVILEGDTVVYQEYDEANEKYTGEIFNVGKVTHVHSSYGMTNKYVVLSFGNKGKAPRKKPVKKNSRVYRRLRVKFTVDLEMQRIDEVSYNPHKFGVDVIQSMYDKPTLGDVEIKGGKNTPNVTITAYLEDWLKVEDRVKQASTKSKKVYTFS